MGILGDLLGAVLGKGPEDCPKGGLHEWRDDYEYDDDCSGRSHHTGSTCSKCGEWQPGSAPSPIEEADDQEIPKDHLDIL
jgi:hypothetical protein